MATPGQFIEQSMLRGWESGAGEKQARQDAVWENQFDQLRQNDLDLQKKYSQTNDPTIRKQIEDSMIQNRQEWRKFLHEGNNPGVVQKFARRFMEHIGALQKPYSESVTTQPTLTIPKDVAGAQGAAGAAASPAAIPFGPKVTVQGPKMTDKERQKLAKTQADDQAFVHSLESAAPLSPEEVAAQNRRIDEQDMKDKVDTAVGIFKKNNPNATQDDLNNFTQLITESMFGIHAMPQRKPVGQPYFDRERGVWLQRYDLADGTTALEEIPGYSQTPKPPSGALGAGLDSYSRSHGFASFDEIPDQYRDAVMNYEIRKQAYDKAFPTATTTTRLVQDSNNNWIPVTVTTYKTPGGGVEIQDPLPESGAPPSAQGQSQGAQAVPQNPEEHPKTRPASAPASEKHSGVSVGQPLFAGKSPELSAARKKQSDAVALVSFANSVLQHPENVQEQKQLAFMMARVMANRFQMQEYDVEVKNAGLANTFQQWLNNFTSGALPQNIIDHLVQSAKDYKAGLDLQVQSLEHAQPQTGTGNAPQETPDVNSLINGFRELKNRSAHQAGGK